MFQISSINITFIDNDENIFLLVFEKDLDLTFFSDENIFILHTLFQQSDLNEFSNKKKMLIIDKQKHNKVHKLSSFFFMVIIRYYFSYYIKNFVNINFFLKFVVDIFFLKKYI